MYLIGKYYHALEQKGRLSLPKVFREQMGKELVITLGLDGCLFLYRKNDWEQMLENQQDLPFTKKGARDWIRILTNNASEVNSDAMGRILIPEHLRNKAKLNKDAVVVGSMNRVEIWDQPTYHLYIESIESDKESIAENVSEITS